ncbi:MAG: tRNA epoxyqueuosine(34) reductase QueG [Phycisphaerae bacterium]|nr:tRNA epoxyqueuosine(34) reductase QueG [Phycisphaerae bacterium]
MPSSPGDKPLANAPNARQEPDPIALGREVIETCLARGFALAGICAAVPVARADAFRAWLAAGMHGEMGWLAETAETRLDPARELPGAKSIIMVADAYADGSPDAPPGAGEGPRGRVARYARGRDYHWFMKRRLHGLNDALRARHPGHEFRTFVDTAPVHERAHAERAGLGWIGKHTLLLHPRAGSYLLLAGTLTTMDLRDPRDARGDGPPMLPDRCGTCTRCIDACPTGAITPYRVDATRCISYLTLEHRGAIDPGLHLAMRDWVVGCDVCQEVCPYNQPRADRTAHPAYAPADGPAGGKSGTGFDLLAMAVWTEERKREALRGSAAKRADLDMLRRNAAIALTNSVEAGRVAPEEVRAALRALADDPSAGEAARDAARVGLTRLSGDAGTGGGGAKPP